MAEVKSVENITTGKIDFYVIGFFTFMGFVGLWIYYEYFNLGIELLLKVAFWWFVIYSSAVGLCIVWKNLVVFLDFLAEDLIHKETIWKMMREGFLDNFLMPLIMLALLPLGIGSINNSIQNYNLFQIIIFIIIFLFGIVMHFGFYNKHLPKL